MPTTDSVILSNEVKPLYDADFYMAGQSRLYFDPLANLRKVMGAQRGQSFNWPMVESLQPSAGVLTELEDVIPQQMRVNELSVTLQEYGGAVELTKYVAATSYADVFEEAAIANGYHLAESLDLVVRAVMGQGSRVTYQNNRTARSGFEGVGTAADRITPAFVERLAFTTARTWRMPLFDDESVVAPVHPFVLYDLLQGTDVRTMATRLEKSLLFNGEIAYWAGMRLVMTANAKVFYGAGAAKGAPVATTLSSAAAIGDTVINVVSATNITVGDYLALIDGAEPGNTWFDSNELFRVTAVNGTAITGYCVDPGPGDGGGLRYAHPTGTTVNDNSCVYPISIVGPNSVTKIASEYTGPYGETVVVPGNDRLGRTTVVGWYALLGYNRTRAGWVPRGECGASEA